MKSIECAYVQQFNIQPNERQEIFTLTLFYMLVMLKRLECQVLN